MKSNWIKYIFIIFIIGILVFAIFKIRQEEEEKKQELEFTNTQEEKDTELKLGIARIRYYESNFEQSQKCTRYFKIDL